MQELTSLTALSLADNPVADISPLVGLTKLKVLMLSGSKAQDYSVLSNLVNLKVLMLDNSTISDLTPLAGLTNLRQIHLANSTIEDLYPLETIYSNLEDKDFIIATTLAELGFSKSYEDHEAKFSNENLDLSINHSSWGPPPMEQNVNSVRISLPLEDGFILKATYHPEIDAYAFGMGRDGALLMDYVYDVSSGDFTFGEGDRASTEQVVRAAFDVIEDEDPLLVPMRVFNDTIKNTFGRSVKGIYAMPFEPPTLRNLGFHADQPNAVYLYEFRSADVLDDVNIEVHHPEWGEKDFDVRFFTPISDEYRVVITWHQAERKIIVKADDNDQGGGSFEYFIDTGEHLDIWCSYPDKTVEEYFIKAYNDPAIEDIYQHSVDLMTQYVSNTFGMTLEELYSLPTGE